MPNPSRAYEENGEDLQTEVQPERRIMKLELGDFGEAEAVDFDHKDWVFER
jgi:hypothetical protein